MAKVESSFKNMVLTLFVVTLVAALALAGVYNVTKEPITLAQKLAKEAAIKEVIPAFDELKSFRAPIGGDDTTTLTFSQGIKDGEVVGTAVLSFTKNGYDPTIIKVMVGITPNGEIKNTQVVQQKETPGLGTKIELPSFKDQFMNTNPKTFILKVKKDGGDVDAITAATISARAFCEAVELAYNTYEKYMEDNK